MQHPQSCRRQLPRRERLRGVFNLLCCHKADSDPYRMLALLKCAERSGGFHEARANAVLPKFDCRRPEGP